MIVNTIPPYPYAVGNYTDILIDTIRSIGNYNKIVIVSDRNVALLHGKAVSTLFHKADYDVRAYVFEGGEKAKILPYVESLCKFLERERFDRSGLIVALGGGIVTDFAGFAAAIYKRGVDYINVPTTLLAAIDAAVGGKTGVNIGVLKNQLGCFYQPKAVITDTAFFSTLPEKELRNGLAEAVKYKALGAYTEYSDYSELVKKCAAYKAELVVKDTYDKGERRLLNFGHTIGHAIESATKNAVGHGMAVAAGMLMLTRMTEKNGLSAVGTYDRLKAELNSEGVFPSEISCVDVKRFICCDKKICGDTLTISYLKEFGKPALLDLPLFDFLEGGKWI